MKVERILESARNELAEHGPMDAVTLAHSIYESGAFSITSRYIAHLIRNAPDSGILRKRMDVPSGVSTKDVFIYYLPDQTVFEKPKEEEIHPFVESIDYMLHWYEHDDF